MAIAQRAARHRGPSCRAASSPHARIWLQKSLSVESIGCWGAQRPERVASGSKKPRATRAIVLPKCRKGNARTSLEYTRVVLSPALAWYPRIRRALRGTPTLAHQLRSVTFSEWLVYNAAWAGGHPQRTRISRRWTALVRLRMPPCQEFLARAHTWHEEVVGVEVRKAELLASIQPGLRPRNLSHSP